MVIAECWLFSAAWTKGHLPSLRVETKPVCCQSFIWPQRERGRLIQFIIEERYANELTIQVSGSYEIPRIKSYIRVSRRWSLTNWLKKKKDDGVQWRSVQSSPEPELFRNPKPDGEAESREEWSILIPMPMQREFKVLRICWSVRLWNQFGSGDEVGAKKFISTVAKIHGKETRVYSIIYIYLFRNQIWRAEIHGWRKYAKDFIMVESSTLVVNEKKRHIIRSHFCDIYGSALLRHPLTAEPHGGRSS